MVEPTHFWAYHSQLSYGELSTMLDLAIEQVGNQMSCAAK